MKQQKAKLSPLRKVKAITVRLIKSDPARLLFLLFTCLILGIVTWVVMELALEPSGEGWVMPVGSQDNPYDGATGDGLTVLSANVGNLDIRCLPWLTDKSEGGAFPENAQSAYTLYDRQRRRVYNGKHTSPL